MYWVYNNYTLLLKGGFMYYVGLKSFKTIRDSFRFQVQGMVAGERRRFHSHGVKIDAIRRYFAQMFEPGCFRVGLDDYDLVVVCKKDPVLKRDHVQYLDCFKMLLSKYRCEVINQTVFDITHFKFCLTEQEREKYKKMLAPRHLTFILRHLGYVPLQKRLKVLGHEYSVWYASGAIDEQLAREIVRDYHLNYF